jgi:Tripartite tricarboxylate transporter TctB family
MNAKIVSGLLLALCAIGIWQATIIPESTMYSEVGPILAPSVVIGILTLLGIIYLLTSLKGNSPDCIQSEDEVPLDGGNCRIFYFLISGMLFILLIKPIGFLIPATICGVGVAKSFDAPLNVKTISICLSITLAFWGLFSALLGVDLGPLFKLPF